MRLRPEQHLRRQSDIRTAREGGRRVDCRAFTLWCRLPGGSGLRRACFVASTQAVGNAVLRNRAKRRLREVFRRHQRALPVSCDVLFIARQAVNHWDFPQLERAFGDACGRLRAESPRKP
jgi:ribonuclease P protein component